LERFPSPYVSLPPHEGETALDTLNNNEQAAAFFAPAHYGKLGFTGFPIYCPLAHEAYIGSRKSWKLTIVNAPSLMLFDALYFV
jgi:hypothetical protein